MYSIFCAVAIFFVIFVVPETKGRDLDSIAKLFAKNRNDSTQMPRIATNAEKPSTAALNKAYKSSSLNSLQNGINSSGTDVTKL